MAVNICEMVEDDWHGNYNGAPDGSMVWIENQHTSSHIGHSGSLGNYGLYT